MAKQITMQTTLGWTAPLISGASAHPLVERLLAPIAEWRVRRSLEFSLGHLSEFHLRDVGLIKADVEAVCADGYGQSALSAISHKAQSRTGNW